IGRRAISRAFSIERRLEKIRSWKRCSVGSSNNNARSRSLESGVILFRLNQELLPDPGNPIARTTVPLGGRAGTTGTPLPAAALATGAASAEAGAPPSAALGG